jgi:hypothetical protein
LCRIYNLRLLFGEKDKEVVKRSGRNEPMWVAIHNCIEEC